MDKVGMLITKQKDLAALVDHIMTIPAISELQQKIGYEFNNRELLLQALTHRSFVHEWPYFALLENERFEFLGDAILNTIISTELFERYSHLSEGDLSKFRAAIVNTEELAKWARFLGMENCLLVGKGEKKNGHFKERPLAQAMEALLAAIFIDLNQDYLQTKKILLRFLSHSELESDIKIFDESLIGSYDVISQLQEVMMASKSMPEYRLIKCGMNGGPPFEIGLYLFGKEVARVTGPSKKKAHRILARMALEQQLYQR